VTFTYNLASTDATILAVSKVRLELGDTVFEAGVRPDNSNLSDEEITIWLTDEDNHVMRTAARACEALARMWSPVSNHTLGPEREDAGAVSEKWQKMGKAIRDQYGGSSSSAFSISMEREDGYSEQATANDYGRPSP